MSEFVDPFRLKITPPAASSLPAGSLSGLRLAVKDLIDLAGVTTGAGNPTYLAAGRPAERSALSVARLMSEGARPIGKTHTDEFAFSLSGTNVHYGTPRNVAAPGRIPGGSSSGSAAAVAAGMVDVALGTDTAGSIRVPASYCGIYGFRPTHGRVPLSGILPLSVSFDTCGLFVADPALLTPAAHALLKSAASTGVTHDPTPPAVLVLATDLLGQADPGVATAVRAGAERLAAQLGVELRTATLAAPERLDGWLSAFRCRQMVEAWQANGRWLEEHQPSLGPGIAARFASASRLPERAGDAARPARDEVLWAFDRVLPSGGALVLPAAATVAPEPDLAQAAKEDLRLRTMRLTCVAGLAGAPAVALPSATADDGLPAGICLLARPGEDEALLAAAAQWRRPHLPGATACA